jgi:hypothetical protein
VQLSKAFQTEDLTNFLAQSKLSGERSMTRKKGAQSLGIGTDNSGQPTRKKNLAHSL